MEGSPASHLARTSLHQDREEETGDGGWPETMMKPSALYGYTMGLDEIGSSSLWTGIVTQEEMCHTMHHGETELQQRPHYRHNMRRAEEMRKKIDRQGKGGQSIYSRKRGK
jgi:hypothetical protein